MDDATKAAVADMIAAQVQPLSGAVDGLRSTVAALDDKCTAMAEGLAELSHHVTDLAGADVAQIGDIAAKMEATIAHTRTLFVSVFGQNALDLADAQEALKADA